MANVTKVTVSLDDSSLHDFMNIESAIVGLAAMGHTVPTNETQHDAPTEEVGVTPSEATAPTEGEDSESAEGEAGVDGEDLTPTTPEAGVEGVTSTTNPV